MFLPIVQFVQVTSSCGTTRRPNPRTRGEGRSATSVAVRGTSSPHGPRSMRELRRLGLHKRSPCGGLAPPTPTSDQDASVDGPRCAERTPDIARSSRRRRGRVFHRRRPGAHAAHREHEWSGHEGAGRRAVWAEASGARQAKGVRPAPTWPHQPDRVLGGGGHEDAERRRSAQRRRKPCSDRASVRRPRNRHHHERRHRPPIYGEALRPGWSQMSQPRRSRTVHPSSRSARPPLHTN